MPHSATPKFIGAVQDEWQLYSDNANDYSRGPPIGFGASSIVYTALFNPPNSPGSTPLPCALKVLDLDRLPPHSLRLLQRETQLMSLSKHPNVLRVRGTWMEGHKLYIALRLMNAGSAADVMRYGWPGGMEEEVVKSILKQALQGINYLHINGFIHRDIKAANFLIDDDGTVLLGDLGVAAFLWESEDPSPSSSSSKRTNTSPPIIPSTSFPTPIPRHHHHKPRTLGKRKSFVGTPCWMAPEVINGKQYDASADIWSFGITALELTQGRPPRSREKPHNVLLHIVQDAPPTLDRLSGVHKYSKSFQDIITSCLNKDPTLRPSALELLQTPFFRNAKKKGYLVNTILKELPPLTKRQERRKQPSIMAHATIDSWDFGTTVGASPISPTSSVYGPHKPGRQIGHVPSGSVFEIEDDVDEDDGEGGMGGGGGPPRSIDSTSRGDGESASAYAERITGKMQSYGMARHPRGVSWAMGKEEGEDEIRVSSSLEGELKGSGMTSTLSKSKSSSSLRTSRSRTSRTRTSLEDDTIIPLPLSSTTSVSIRVPNIMTTEHLSSPGSSSDMGGLPVPKPHHGPSTSPAASSCSSATSMSTSVSGSGEPVTPPSLGLPSFWRKLRGGWGEDKDKERDRHLHPHPPHHHHPSHSLREKDSDRDMEKEKDRDTTEQTTRKKPFSGSILSRSSVAAAGAVLVRTVSRNQKDGAGGSEGSPSDGKWAK